MKNNIVKLAPVFFLMLFTLTGCEAIGTIFKTGFNIGVFVVIVAIIIIGVIFSKLRNK